MILIITTIIQVNGFIGLMTFQPKYMEQTYGQSASRAIFLIGEFTFAYIFICLILISSVSKYT